MAEYLMHDRDKAAFTNKMNDFLGQVKPGTKLNTQNFIDIPGKGTNDKCIFVTDNQIEIELLDQLIDDKTFSYPIKKINLKEMVEASRR